jgi:hypothetical protein
MHADFSPACVVRVAMSAILITMERMLTILYVLLEISSNPPIQSGCSSGSAYSVSMQPICYLKVFQRIFGCQTAFFINETI